MTMHQNDSEQWVFIPGTDNQYQANPKGFVRSVPIDGTIGRKRGRQLNPKPNKHRKNYLSVQLCVIGRKPKYWQLHRIIALVFLGPCPEGMQVNHKDGNKSNNHVDNLEYVTCLENIRHCWSNGLHGTEHCRGVRNNKAKLTEDDVRQIRTDYPTSSMTQLAKRFNVSVHNISSIIRRKMWKHI